MAALAVSIDSVISLDFSSPLEFRIYTSFCEKAPRTAPDSVVLDYPNLRVILIRT